MTNDQKKSLDRHRFIADMVSSLDKYAADPDPGYVTEMFEIVAGEMGRLTGHRPKVPESVKDGLW